MFVLSFVSHRGKVDKVLTESVKSIDIFYNVAQIIPQVEVITFKLVLILIVQMYIQLTTQKSTYSSSLIFSLYITLCSGKITL